MLITIHDASHIRLTEFDRPDFEVETAPEAEATFHAMQMFGTSLGLCTASVLATYGEHFDAGMDDLIVEVDWDYADDPYRVDDIDMEIQWPSLPDSRRQAAERAARQCTIHNTLHHDPTIETKVETS